MLKTARKINERKVGQFSGKGWTSRWIFHFAGLASSRFLHRRAKSRTGEGERQRKVNFSFSNGREHANCAKTLRENAKNRKKEVRSGVQRRKDKRKCFLLGIKMYSRVSEYFAFIYYIAIIYLTIILLCYY